MHKHQWYFSVDFYGTHLEDLQIKLKERPQLQDVAKDNRDGTCTIETQEWKPLVTTLYNDESDKFMQIYEMLSRVYDYGSTLFKEKNPKESLEKFKDFLGVGQLVLKGSLGEVLEHWEIKGIWPHSVNFGELCYDTSDTVELEITWRYKDCKLVKPIAI